MDTIDHNWLKSQKCVPCEGGTPPMPEGESKKLLAQLKNKWLLEDGKKIRYQFILESFPKAIEFVNIIGVIAEEEGHHPDISIYYKKVEILLWTHAVGGLTQNDFVLAAKIEDLYNANYAK